MVAEQFYTLQVCKYFRTFGYHYIIHSIILTDGLNGITFSYEDQVKAHFIVFETLIESQEDQILGIVHIGDFSGASKQHVTLWTNPTDLMRLLKWGEQSLPLRHKEIHLYNVSAFLKFVVDAGKGVMSSKIKNRINVSS